MAINKKIDHDQIFENIEKQLSTPAEVYDPKTGNIVFAGSYWDCYQLVWDQDRPLSNARRNGLEIRELTTDAAKILYTNNK